jgi:hypothetical protein
MGSFTRLPGTIESRKITIDPRKADYQAIENEMSNNQLSSSLIKRQTAFSFRLCFFKNQRRTIHTIPKPGWSGPIVKNVA